MRTTKRMDISERDMIVKKFIALSALSYSINGLFGANRRTLAKNVLQDC